MYVKSFFFSKNMRTLTCSFIPFKFWLEGCMSYLFSGFISKRGVFETHEKTIPL